MTNTPVPRVKKQGATSLLAALVASGLVFITIPLAQWTSTLIDPPFESDTRPQVLPPPPQNPSVPPPEEAKKPEKAPDIKPPSLADIEIILSPIKVQWDGWSNGSGMGSGFSQIPDLDDIVDQSLLDSPPQPSARVSPNYHGNVRGRVDVLAVVDERGRVTAVSISRRLDPMVDRLAMDAVRKWKFQPGTVDGKPTKFKVLIPFVFSGR